MTPQRRELVPHLVILAALGAATLVLVLWPWMIVSAGYHCMLRTLTGFRCPFCGMTRDFAAMLHGGRPAWNPSSRAAAIVIYGFYPAAVLAAWKAGRLRWFYARPMRVGLAFALAVMMLANNWH